MLRNVTLQWDRDGKPWVNNYESKGTYHHSNRVGEASLLVKKLKIPGRCLVRALNSRITGNTLFSSSHPKNPLFEISPLLTPHILGVKFLTSTLTSCDFTICLCGWSSPLMVSALARFCGNLSIYCDLNPEVSHCRRIPWQASRKTCL